MTSLEDEAARQVAGPWRGPAEEAETQDRYSQVLASMQGLPEKQQEVLRLKFQHGLSYKEISQLTEDSIGNVGWLLHKALKSLKDRLAGGEMQGVEA